MELIQVLTEHAARYPEMRPSDAVKLIYQNEMGAAHLISDAAKCLSRIRSEYHIARRSPGPAPKWEDIGNGWVRFPLLLLDGSKESFAALSEIFVLSSQEQSGSLPSLWKKLDRMMVSFPVIPFSFSKEEMLSYLAWYRKEGSPAVSHSDLFREKYAPAYRIIRKSMLDRIAPFSAGSA